MDLSKDYARPEAGVPGCPEMGRCAEAEADRWTATGHERPVFLDERGRRRRWVLVGGALAGVLAALWLAGLLVGAVGFSRLPSTYAPIRHAAAHISTAALVERRQDLLASRHDLIANTRRGPQLRRAIASVPHEIARA
jgi:hypothetical protein